MDENKRLKLHEIGYEIKPSCATCIHGKFPINDWGTCGLFTYDHLKHDGTHFMSINKLGSCVRYEADGLDLRLWHYKEFLKT